MPAPGVQRSRFEAVFEQKIAEGADAGEVARMVLAALAGVDAALAPIIGKGGVAALYKRTVHLVGRTYPWLGLREGPSTSIDTGDLTIALSQQTAADAAAGGSAVLQTFCDLLISLVGASLTERLLKPVLGEFPFEKDTKDPAS